MNAKAFLFVIPAQAGIQHCRWNWIPVSTGMTKAG